MKKWIKIAVLGIVGLGVGVFLLLQLVPYGGDHSNPPISSEPNWDNPETRALAERACFDCHSNETVWPWYSHVAPVSWLVQYDAKNGRRALNFSTWNEGGDHEAHEAAEVISEGEMPPSIYLITHPEARLTADEKEALIDGLRATVRN